jgi:hypothetical protein
MNEEFPHPGSATPWEPAGPTGDEQVDDAVAPLGRLAGLPVEDHVAVLEEMHGRLRDVLSEMDAAEDPGERP